MHQHKFDTKYGLAVDSEILSVILEITVLPYTTIAQMKASKMTIGIWVLSDIHVELIRNSEPPTFDRPAGADIAVIAGDIHHADRAVGEARRLVGPEIPLIIVCGNHEHYGNRRTVADGLELMHRHAEGQRSIGIPTWVLENECVELTIGGEPIRFIGATLWTDFELFGNAVLGMIDAVANLNDFRMIRSADRNVMPDEMARWHRASKCQIADVLGKPFVGNTVVVTHHLPSMRSVASIYRTSPITTGFASNCDDLLDMGTDLWIHGHTHSSADYLAGPGDRTRVVCNPRGYQRGIGIAENLDFQANLVIDVGHPRSTPEPA